MLPLPTGNRIEVSKQTGNEKLFSEDPSRHHILLNSPTGQFNINGSVIPLTMGSSYRCDWRELNLNKVNAVIIIENLQAFDYIQMAQIPKELENAWILYRGHDISTKARNDLLNALPQQTKIIGFVDYDLAGFKILLTNFPKITHCLFPSAKKQWFDLAKGTRERFKKQQLEEKYCDSISLPKNLQKHWELLKKEKYCLSQEIMLSHNIPLIEYLL